MSPKPESVAIIGAGLGGLTLALALRKFGIPAKLIELRTPDYDFGGAIMISPNALRVLDSIGAYERIRTKGFSFQTLTFKTDHDLKTTGQYYFGDAEMYGYDALRIYRNILIAELRAMVQEQGITIEHGRRFSHIVSEDEHGVKFAFADGSTEETPLLIGADGIHSTVRKYISPDIVPVYSGFLGVTYAFPRSNLRLPPGNDAFPLPVSIHAKGGAYILAPQNPDGQEVFAGRQFLYPMQDRSGWDALLKDKQELIEMHQRDMKDWSDLVQSGLEQASTPAAHSFNIWPFHTLPKLPAWASARGKVVIVGDAAHAVPPTAGQGANQAFEDSLSLALLLRSLPWAAADLSGPLRKWQEYRQARIDKVLELSDHMNTLRLSEAEKKLLQKEKAVHNESYNVGVDGQLGWLYLSDVEADMSRVLQS